MKKTIILQQDYNAKTMVLEQVMRAALAFGWVISKSAIIFNSKKEAQELIKNHVCGKGCKTYTLNQRQEQALKTLKEAKDRQYISMVDFLAL